MVIRTAIIKEEKLEEFLQELRNLGDSISQRGGNVNIDEENGHVEFEGIKMNLKGPARGPYMLIIEGDDCKKDLIESYSTIFSKFR